MKRNGRRIAMKVLASFMVVNMSFGNIATVYADETDVYMQQSVTELEEGAELEVGVEINENTEDEASVENLSQQSEQKKEEVLEDNTLSKEEQTQQQTEEAEEKTKVTVEDFSEMEEIEEAEEALSTEVVEEKTRLLLDAGIVYSDAEEEVVSIQEAKNAAIGTEDIVIKGTVILVDGRNIYLQDETAGIDAYYDVAPSDINIGDILTVKGTRATYNGLEELKNAVTVSIVKAEKDITLPAKTVTIKELLDDYASDGAYESTRVYLENVKLGTINTNGNTTITDADGKSINIYKIPALSECEESDIVSLYVVIGDFKGYQLRVANEDDIILVEAVEEKDENTEESKYDPISDELIASVEGAVNVKEASGMTNGTVSVVGQVVYKYASKPGDDLINILLEDVIDNEIYGYLIYDYNNEDSYQIGDVVAVTGTATVYSGVPELTMPSAPVILETGVEPIVAQKVTVAALGADYLSEYVYLENVTLGAYNANGNTKITDETGSINIYRGAAFPEGVEEGTTADIYAACSAYNTTYQLRNGASADYKLEGTQTDDKYEIDESIELNVASFAGTLKTDQTVVYGDLYQANDFLDEDAKLFLSTGKAPFVTDTSTGSKGLTENEYYQLEVNAKQYANMELSFRMRGSKTGARDFVLDYSTDGVDYQTAGKGRLKASYTIYSSEGQTPVEVDKEIKDGAFSLVVDSKFHDINISLPADANDAETLYLRMRVASSVSIKGETIGSSGTNYFNEIKLTGNPILSDKACKYVTAEPKAGQAAIGQELSFKTATKDAVIYYTMNQADDFMVYDEAAKPVITELPCAVTVYAAKDGLDDSLKITYQYTQAQVGVVKATPNGGAVAKNSKVKLTCETEGATILYAVTNAEAVVSEDSILLAEVDGVPENTELTWQIYTNPIVLNTLPCTIAVKAFKTGWEDSAVKTLNFTERENEKYNIYFGQLHAHTSYSDGAGTCEEAFAYAQNVDNLDFLAITDHSNSFDNADSASITDGSMSSEWVEGHELAKKYTTEDFVGLYGYEMTWSNGLGHMNTFNTPGFQSRTQDAYTNYSTALRNYYETLQETPDSINQFNHPGTTFGDFSDFAHYSEANDALITTIEVGNGEGAIGSSGYFPSYEYYTRALDKGWHVAPTNNQDNHKGKWGAANTARSVVLADSLTEENIYDAMRNYRVYATEDNDLNIYYTLDSYVMGTVLDKDMVGEQVEIKVDLQDETDSKLGKVEIIVNGGLSIASQNVDTCEEVVTFKVPSSYSYYYVKVTQADGDIAVTAPIWVGEVEAAGINDISTDEPLPVTGEALDVTLDLYNNEVTDMTIQSIEFKVDGKVVEAVDLASAGLTKLASESTCAYTFSYTYNKVGSMEMEVVVKAKLAGADKVYMDVLQLTYVDSSMVSHVVIDGTHYNDYVTGYYGGNMGSFVEICADKNIKAKIVTDEITKEMLEEASLLVISAPAKKSGTANEGDYVVSHFEDSFIKLVKEYVENGGSVIVCGLADYQDRPEGQTATETNKLLEAIGSTIRMNSDEAYDEEKNGGQPYRLYYENMNLDSEYLDGFVNGQTYSAYSGCTVDITNATQETGVVYPAQWLVKGFDSTYSIDCKTDEGANSDSSVYVEKGNVVALASQKTKFGGEIVVAGSVFMSDFEVDAEIDNNDSLPYANYTIINNILDGKQAEIEVTDIATVRRAEVGDVFAIEGYIANGTENENTTFFDAIYVQDTTAGITVFPFSKAGIKSGTRIRIVGYVDQYQGDKELQIVSYEILDDENLVAVEPKELSVKNSMDYENYGGSLIKVKGRVSKVEQENNVVSEFWLTDENGNEAAVFIDGYIASGTTGKNTISAFIKEGETVTAVGFLYKHPEGGSDESVPVLRVRDCDEIILVQDINDDNSGESTEGGSNSDVDTSGNSFSNNIKESKSVLQQIVPQQIPLAEAVSADGLPYVDVVLNGNEKLLGVELLQKYYGRNLYLMAHLGNGIGYSINAADMQSVTEELELASSLQSISDEEGFKAFYMKKAKEIQLNYMVGIHMQVGQEYTGNIAYLFQKSILSGEYQLKHITTVDEIGNVALQTNELTDIVIMITQ